MLRSSLSFSQIFFDDNFSSPGSNGWMLNQALLSAISFTIASSTRWPCSMESTPAEKTGQLVYNLLIQGIRGARGQKSTNCLALLAGLVPLGGALVGKSLTNQPL
jgi:hypothetical protein